MQKVCGSAAEALEGLPFDGMTIAAGGFGLCGIPEILVAAIEDAGTAELTVASNDAGVDSSGFAGLLQTRKVKRITSSYVGENAKFMRQNVEGELELEFTPQGPPAGPIRAGGAGILSFHTPTGVGAQVAEGKEHNEFDGRTHAIKRAIVADLSSVKAWKADDTDNLICRKTARNFNPPTATCGSICVAEVEQIVPPRGEVEGNAIHLPGIFVHRQLQGEHEKAN